MTCPECKTGILKRNRKPDALNRIIERCDSCPYRRVVSGGAEEVSPLSGSFVRQTARVNGSAPGAPSEPAAQPAPRVPLAPPLAVVGEPCPCCHRPVKKLPLCVKCNKNRRVLGKSRCEECSKPRSAKPRYCVTCGDQFTPEPGEKLAGTAAYHCPKHRAPKKSKRAPALATSETR